MKLFQMVGERMRWLNDRQRVLAQNVANADTPGYNAKDLPEPDFRRLLGNSAAQLKLAGGDAGHLTGGAAGDRLGGRALDKPGDRTVSGNSVVLEDEMMKVAETAANYELMTNLYAKHLGMIRTALGRGGR